MNQSSREAPPGRRRPRSALELVLDFLNPGDWGSTFRQVVTMLGAAMALVLVLGGLIGLAVVVARISPGFALGVGVGAGPLLAARLRRRAGPAEDESRRPAVG